MFGEAGHKILHRARSLRRLRPHEEPSSHKRGISVSSDTSRASSSGSDTTSRRGNSVEWDPLHMHPSMEVDRSPHMTPLYHSTSRRPQHHHEDDSEQEQSPTISQQAFSRPRNNRPGVDTQIYEGFDFGFSETQATHPTGLSPHSRMMRALKSEADLKRQKAAASKDDEPQWNGLHSPNRLRQVPDGGFDEADYFIKRGGWKRRGIVFGLSAETHESEDDCFDI